MPVMPVIGRAMLRASNMATMIASTRMPPLLFDDEQVVALAVALRNALVTGAGIEEAAARALVPVRQVMPARLRGRLDALEFSVGDDGPGPRPQVDTEVLLTIATAVRARRPRSR